MMQYMDSLSLGKGIEVLCHCKYTSDNTKLYMAAHTGLRHTSHFCFLSALLSHSLTVTVSPHRQASSSNLDDYVQKEKDVSTAF